MPADPSINLTTRFYPHHRFSKKEIDTVLLAANIMRSDYCKHYPEAEQLAVFYKEKHLSTAALATSLDTVPPEELSRRSNVAIALGFYVLSAPVALYFMRLSPMIYINCLNEYIEEATIDWSQISFQDTLISVLLFNSVKEMTHDHYEKFMKDLIEDIPVPSDYKEEINNYMVGFLNQCGLSPHTVH